MLQYGAVMCSSKSSNIVEFCDSASDLKGTRETLPGLKLDGISQSQHSAADVLSHLAESRSLLPDCTKNKTHAIEYCNEIYNIT